MHRNGYKTIYAQSFKETLIDIALVIANVERSTWNYWYTAKETPRVELGGLSCRQFLIKVSENAIKPAFGNGYFGNAAANKLLHGMNVFTDGGFVEEIEPIIQKIGVENVIIVRLSRNGHTFKNDSRNYIYIPSVASFDIKNEKLDDAFTEICLKLGLVKK